VHHRSSRLGLGLRLVPGMVSVLLVTSAASAAPPSVGGTAGIVPTGTTPPEWAWAVDTLPGAESIPSLGPNYGGNSYGATNGVARLGVGWYRVTLTHVGAPSGNVLVSALSSHPRFCLVDTWTETGSAPTDETVDVRCYAKTGLPSNTRFIVNWQSASDVGGRMAYANNWSPTSGGSAPLYWYDSFGGTITLYPGSSGKAELHIPYLGSYRGTVQVSATAHNRNDDPATTSVGFCDLVSFHSFIGDASDHDEYVASLCYNLPVDSSGIYREHNVWFMQGLGMKGFGGTNVAYLWANRPAAGSYTPDTHYSYSSPGGSIHVTRLGVGSYSVLLTGMPKGGSAQVTAFGTDPRHCTISSIATSSPQKVGVRCFDAAGVAQDAKFTLAYAR